ncbi:TPA: type II toxin-antitoxin system RelE/ParE family toxin [Campylobacter jejuni]|nr:type II toxin-antitoxin system RelE/ParE family toxin [Campylobacter jejuni]
MQIIQTYRFLLDLEKIADFISLDSIKQANLFLDNLEKSIENIPFMPYKNRKSLSFDNENIRDLIFKGYVIPYLIDKSKNEILILGIYKNNLWD